MASISKKLECRSFKLTHKLEETSRTKCPFDQVWDILRRETSRHKKKRYRSKNNKQHRIVARKLSIGVLCVCTGDLTFKFNKNSTGL